MRKCYIEQFAKMLGVEIGEEFNLKLVNGGYSGEAVGKKRLYRFTKENFEVFKDDVWVATGMHLDKLLKGSMEIVKLPWKPLSGEKFYYPVISDNRVLCVAEDFWTDGTFATLLAKEGLIYQTLEECATHLEEDYLRIMGKKYELCMKC